MQFKTILLGTAALALMAGQAFAQDATQDPPKKHHHHHMMAASGASSVDARIDQLEREIQELKEQQAQAAAQPAPSDTVSQAQFEALQNQVYEEQAATASLTKSSWWAKTKISGRMYFDLTNVSAKTSGVKNPQEGTHFDIKRFYLSVDHDFDDVWSADLTTDVTYDSGIGVSQVYIKKAYLQAKLAPWAIFRAGSADMPWIPFAEDVYGYRYVENTLVDRLKQGNSADWGAFFLGSFGDELKFEYSLAAVNGAGYKKPGFGLGTNRSSGMDFEGRADVKWNDFVLGIGGYDGKLGKELTPNTTHHDASRFDAILGYVGNGFHVGVEYYSQNNWDTVTSVNSDSGDGWSGFAAYQFSPEWAVFGRYDDTKPEKKTLPGYHNTYYNFGIEYTPVKIVNLSLVYKHEDGKHGIYGTSNGSIGGVGLDPKGNYDEIGLFGQLRW